jgi:AcrR family transcriptional regulator
MPRGRPRASESAERRQAVLDAAYAVLAEQGYERTSMLAVAQRAGASKETLYSWFGGKAGLFAAVIQSGAAPTNAVGPKTETSADDDPRAGLVAMMTNLLTLLTGERSVTVNRAAIAAPELAEVLLAQGRHRTGPLIAGHLRALMDRGVLVPSDPEVVVRTLYGLVIRDSQIRVLLGEPAPDPADIATQAEQGVDAFLRLYAAGSPTSSLGENEERA